MSGEIITWEFPSSAVSGGGASSVPAGETDHVAEALERLPQQFKTDTSVVSLLTALVRPCQSLETALQDMLVDRAVDTAVGAQLDIIGRLVGQARNGLDDDVYRLHIKARIKTSRSHGTVADLLTIAKLVIGSTVRVVVRNRRITDVWLTVPDEPVNDDVADAAITFLRLAVAGGVRLVLVTSVSEPEARFRFNSGPGFNQGHLAAART
jgi:hypothetical protein